jgi:NADH-quinone oxidoreductase subunit C
VSQAQPQPPAAPRASPQPPAPPKPEPVRAKDLASRLASKFPDTKTDWMKERRLKVTVPLSRFAEACEFARDELGFDHISAVSGVDWIANNQLEVVYFVGSLRQGWTDFVLALAERLPREDPVAKTMIGVWPGAEYQERETHEMFGINFQGHPDQSHILLPEDWNDLPPLRKDYISPGR